MQIPLNEFEKLIDEKILIEDWRTLMEMQY